MSNQTTKSKLYTMLKMQHWKLVQLTMSIQRLKFCEMETKYIILAKLMFNHFNPPNPCPILTCTVRMPLILFRYTDLMTGDIKLLAWAKTKKQCPAVNTIFIFEVDCKWNGILTKLNCVCTCKYSFILIFNKSDIDVCNIL